MSGADELKLHAALDAYDQGQLQQAEPTLRDLATRYPRNYQVNEALGSVYAEEGAVERALPYLQAACRVAPGEAIAHANLGAAYLKLGRAGRESDKALREPGEAGREAIMAGRESVLAADADRTGQAIRELRRAAALDPGNAATLSTLGEALVQGAQPGAAAKAFGAAAALSPNDAGLSYNRALALFESGSEAGAADVLEALPEVARTDQIYALAGDAEERSGRYERALSSFQAAARLNPSDANLYALTVELLRHWTWAEAIAVADFGAKKYPESRHFPMAAGVAYYGKSDYEGAVKVFSAMLAKEPDNARVADLLGRSCSLLSDGVDAGCNGMYEFAVRHPGNATTTTYAAVAILHEPRERQDLDRAAALLRTAIAADPKYAEAYFEMGVLEQARLRWKESAEALERSIALRPNSPEAHYRLSRAYTHMGRRDEAQAQIVLHQTYSDEAKNHLDAKMQEVVRFLLKPS